MCDSKVLTHEQVKKCFSSVYNQFYLKWRLTDKRLRSEDEYDEMIRQADTIRSEFNNSSLVNGLVDAVLTQFTEEERALKLGKAGD